MATLSLQRALLLAGAVLPLAQPGFAQTIVGDDGNVLRTLTRRLQDYRMDC